MNRSYLGNITKYEEIGDGSFSRVYKCDYLDSLFAYKEYLNEDYVKFINDRILKLTQISADNSYVFPYEVVYKNLNDEYFIGYVMNYLFEYNKLCELGNLDYSYKVKILKQCKELVNKLHTKYNFLHTDICPWNFLYNTYKDNLVLIDFDTYIDLKNKEENLDDYYSFFAQDYGNKVRIDKDLDIYLLNLTTYAWLNNIEYNDVLKNINESSIINLDSEHARKIIESYKLLECNKSLRKEYIIDYL